MAPKTAGAATRRRFHYALKAALAAEPWDPQDFPVRLVFDKRRAFTRKLRGNRMRWGHERLDRWGVTVSSDDNVRHLDDHSSWTFGPDERGEVYCSLWHAQTLAIRLTAIGKAAWAAGIRKMDVELTSAPTGHDLMEMASEAGKWHPLAKPAGSPK